jgi:hypothetical protein
MEMAHLLEVVAGSAPKAAKTSNMPHTVALEAPSGIA